MGHLGYFRPIYQHIHFGTVRPFSMFSINQLFFLKKTPKPLYPNPKYLFGIGIGFEFWQQRIMDLVCIPSPTTYMWNIKWQICAGMGLNGLYLEKLLKIKMLQKNKSWEPFRSCLLNSTANSVQFGWKWAGLAVLFSR